MFSNVMFESHQVKDCLCHLAEDIFNLEKSR